MSNQVSVIEAWEEDQQNTTLVVHVHIGRSTILQASMDTLGNPGGMECARITKSGRVWNWSIVKTTYPFHLPQRSGTAASLNEAKTSVRQQVLAAFNSNQIKRRTSEGTLSAP